MSRITLPRFIIRIKNSLTNKRPNNLFQGELAYSFASGDSGQTLYIGSQDSGVSFVVGGAFFTDMLDHTKGTLTPNSAIITDANNKIDKLLVDNTTIDSGDIRTDGNLSLLPSGGNVLVSGNVRTTNQFIGVYAGFDSDFSLKNTDDLTEGSTNLYYTSARSDSDTTDLVDSAYIRARQLTDFPYVDSAMVSRMIDSATGGIDSAVLTRIINLQTIDSAQVDQMLDSAIGAFGIDSASVDQMIDSALQFASTNSRPGQHGLIDSQDVDQMIDSAVSKTHIDTLEIDAGTVDGLNSTQFLRSDVDDTAAGNITLEGQLRGPASFIIDPATVGDNTGTVKILGNLQVEGTQTTINSTTVSLNDKNLVLADSAADSAAADGAGLTINGAGATLTYSASLDDFVFNKPITAPNINVDTITVTETIVGGYAGFDSDFSQKTTDNLTEGSTNLYHTKARVQTLLDSSGHLDSNATDQMIDSAIGFLSTNSRPGIHGLLDSNDIDQMLDSAFNAFTPDTSAFTANALDSSGVDQMLDSALGFVQGARVSFNVGHGGSSNYQFTGDGFPSQVANPALYLYRGVEYYFYLDVSGHPFYIKTVNSTGTGNQYTDGVTGNGNVLGTLIFNVPMDAPNVLHYNCQIHSAMNGPIYIMDQNSFVDSDEVDRMIDSAITGPIRTHIQSFSYLDSNAADQMIDSAMTQVGANTRLLIDSNKAPDSAAIIDLIDARLITTDLVLDSNFVEQMLDSAIGGFHVDSNAVDQMIDSAIGFLSANSRPGVHGLLDSNAIEQMLDSHEANTTHGGGGGGGGGGLDSNAVDQMFDSHLSNVLHSGGAGGGLDSNPVQRMIDSNGGVDSTGVDQMLDSAFNAFTPVTSTFTPHALDSNAVDQMFDSHLSNVTHGGGGGGTVDSADIIAIVDSAYVQSRQETSAPLIQTNFTITADSNQTLFTHDSQGNAISISNNKFQVYLNGLLLPGDDYTNTASSLTLQVATDSGDLLQIVKFDGNTGNALDSNAVDQMFDSHLSNVAHGGTGTGGLDSAEVIRITTPNPTALTITNFTVTADSNQGEFTRDSDDNPISIDTDQFQVFLNGLLLPEDEYTSTSSSITLRTVTDSGDQLQIIKTNATLSPLNQTIFEFAVESDNTTTFTGSDRNSRSLTFNNSNQQSVFINGILQTAEDFSINTSTNTLTLNVGADSGDLVQIVRLSGTSLSNGLDSTAVDQMFDSHVSNLVATTAGVDSGSIQRMIDSNFHGDSAVIRRMIDSQVDSSFVQTRTMIGLSDIDFGPHKILYANMYDSPGLFPSASTYHGMFAHAHNTGAGYYAHAGAWIRLANYDDLGTDSNATDQMIDSAIGFLSANSRPGVHGLIDSLDVDQMLDSAFGAFTPSTATFTAHALDSNAVDQMFDSHLSNVTHGGGGGGGGGLDSAAVRLIADSSAAAVEFKQTQFFFRADSVERDFFADSDGTALSLDSGAFQVYLNGILLPQMEYHNTKTSFHLATSADSGDNINIVKFTGNNVELTKRALSETKFFFTTASPTTSITGADDNGLTLDYSTGLIDVFLNGILLKDSDDFTTNGAGNTVTLVSATDSNDLVTIVNRKGVVVTPSLKTFEYTATAGQTQFSGLALDSSTLSYAPGAIQVYLNGVLLREEDFSATNGTTVTLATGASLNDELVISTFSTPGANLTLFKFTASASQTIFSGTDNAGNRLSYMPGNEQVFLNGLLLNDSDDYVASNGVSVILNTAANVNDELKVASFVHNTNNLVVNPWSAPAASNNASAGDKLFVNTLTGAKTVTLPGTANMGDEIRIIDAEGNANNNNITIARNSHKIMAADSDLVINTSRAAVGLVYYNDSNGWLLIEN